MKNTKRFAVVLKETGSLTDERAILVDKETGVHYLSWKSGYAGGITPLLDPEGNVVINKVSK